MKKIITIFLILFSFTVLSQAGDEPKWKVNLRSYITKYFGEEWSVKIFGGSTQNISGQESVQMPKIPSIVKKTTNVASYSKKPKAPTAYDKLSSDKKRQYNYNFLKELFLATRKLEAKEEDISNWLNTLDQGGSREGVYQALVLDEVYYNLESMQDTPKKKLLDFYVEFSKKYLNQTLKTQAISNLNLFSLKRILTEKSLDVMEHYEVNDLDSLYLWYANFSADCGQKFANLMESEIRKNSSGMVHYNWAKEMPVQHIKSEFIIKIHSVMNELQKSKD